MNDEPVPPSSSPCSLHTLERTQDGSYQEIDEQQRVDVSRWRTAERKRLLAARNEITAEDRQRLSGKVAEQLEALVSPGPGQIISLYWPIRAELDLRQWMHAAHSAGARIALPVVAARNSPLVFRQWAPGARMERGVWNILQPADGESVLPTVTIAPLVGHDPDCFRLGYGGGYFDRTLAAASPRPLVIGVGAPTSAIATIFPQPHDIPMDLIVTGNHEVIRRV